MRTETAALASSGIDPASVVSAADIGGGTYNTAVRLVLADGSRLVLELAPDDPGLAHEHDLLATEAEYHRLSSGPVPSVVGAGPGFLLMTELPGVPWSQVPGTDRPRLRSDLGGIVAHLHKVTGDGFGYPQDPLRPTWPAAQIARLVRRHEPLLELVTTPVLVHFDLWDGNILLDDGRVSGIIDAERAFWGDPVAEFVSLTLFADVDQPLLDGYRAAGGPAEFGTPALARLGLYKVYLDLIMLVEMTPRRYMDANRAQFLTDLLTADIDALQRAV